MAKPVISYDKDLPEVPDRRSWERPDSYLRNYKRLSDLDPLSLKPVYDQEELDEPYRIRLKMEFAITETEIGEKDIAGLPST